MLQIQWTWHFTELHKKKGTSLSRATCNLDTENEQIAIGREGKDGRRRDKCKQVHLHIVKFSFIFLLVEEMKGQVQGFMRKLALSCLWQKTQKP